MDGGGEVLVCELFVVFVGGLHSVICACYCVRNCLGDGRGCEVSRVGLLEVVENGVEFMLILLRLALVSIVAHDVNYFRQSTR